MIKSKQNTHIANNPKNQQYISQKTMKFTNLVLPFDKYKQKQRSHNRMAPPPNLHYYSTQKHKASSVQHFTDTQTKIEIPSPIKALLASHIVLSFREKSEQNREVSAEEDKKKMPSSETKSVYILQQKQKKFDSLFFDYGIKKQLSKLQKLFEQEQNRIIKKQHYRNLSVVPKIKKLSARQKYHTLVMEEQQEKCGKVEKIVDFDEKNWRVLFNRYYWKNRYMSKILEKEIRNNIMKKVRKSTQNYGQPCMVR